MTPDDFNLASRRLIEWDATRPKPCRCDGEGDCPNCRDDDDE